MSEAPSALGCIEVGVVGVLKAASGADPVRLGPATINGPLHADIWLKAIDLHGKPAT